MVDKLPSDFDPVDNAQGYEATLRMRAADLHERYPELHGKTLRITREVLGRGQLRADDIEIYPVRATQDGEEIAPVLFVSVKGVPGNGKERQTLVVGTTGEQLGGDDNQFTDPEMETIERMVKDDDFTYEVGGE